ncbi:MAG: lysostaphin resistance A-like protein [Methanococcaceae archaeon]
MTTDQNHYPSIRHVIMLLLLLILAFAVYFSLTGILLNMPGYTIKDSDLSAVYMVSALILLPFIVYVKKRTDIPGNFSLNFPAIRIMGVLAVLVITLKIIATPFFYSELHFKALNEGNLMINSFDLREPEASTVFKFLHFVILAPIFEEVFFRGQIQTLMMKRYSPAKAIILTSVFFAILHLKPDNLVALFVCGLIFGMVYYRTQSLGAAVFLHFSYNLLDFFSVYKTIIAMDQMFLLNFLAFLLSIVVMSGILIYLGTNPVES